jgi:hypothetical protein
MPGRRSELPAARVHLLTHRYNHLTRNKRLLVLFRSPWSQNFAAFIFKFEQRYERKAKKIMPQLQQVRCTKKLF